MATRRRRAAVVVGAAAALGAVVGGGIVWWSTPPEPTPPARAVSIAIPDGRELVDLAISADARQIAYTAIADGRTRLYVRPLDRFDAVAVDGADGARQPFFSPDGAAIGFFADGWLQTIGVTGGVPTRVCPVPGATAGATWRPDDVIVFAGPGATGLRQVAASGGTPAALTTLDVAGGETGHGWPQAVDARRILFTAGRAGHDPRLTLLDLETGETRPLLPADGGGFPVASSHVVYARRGELFAATLDRGGRRGPSGPRPVLTGVATSALGSQGLGRARLAAARDGTVVYAPPPATGGTNRLVWVDRQGRAVPVDGASDSHESPRLAPDGRRVALGIATAIFRRDLWLLDLGTGDRRQLTVDAGDNHSPVWSGDGSTLTFASSRAGLQQIFSRRVGSLETGRVIVGGDQRAPGSWSPDGRRLAFHEVHPERGRDIWVWEADAGAEAEPWLATAANERAPRFSPDGRWLAYVSDGETGDGDQVYVRSVTDRTRPPVRVSPHGGTEPVWSQLGEALYFRRDRSLFEARIDTDGAALAVAAPVHLFDGPFLADVLDNLPAYDVAPDGRFLMLALAGRVPRVQLVSGWPARVFPAGE